MGQFSMGAPARLGCPSSDIPESRESRSLAKRYGINPTIAKWRERGLRANRCTGPRRSTVLSPRPTPASAGTHYLEHGIGSCRN
jgi:hypothetical protein